MLDGDNFLLPTRSIALMILYEQTIYLAESVILTGSVIVQIKIAKFNVSLFVIVYLLHVQLSIEHLKDTMLEFILNS